MDRFHRFETTSAMFVGARHDGEQAQTEVLRLVRANATIEADSLAQELSAGAWVVIPAGRRHRVPKPSAGALLFTVQGYIGRPRGLALSGCF